MKQLKLLDIKSSFRRLRKHAYDCKSVYGFREMKGGREKLWGLDLSRILAGSEPSFRQRLGILAEKLKKRWPNQQTCKLSNTTMPENKPRTQEGEEAVESLKCRRRRRLTPPRRLPEKETPLTDCCLLEFLVGA
ncbi:hypothetical protein E3N88_43587 [Mikania micrantha]|uniref:Uncharacterized protein n=1 Tax=Mikania micrantha TaxID=192012 RepID=A0A5N6LF84_9ASTR|nr:hypothetical protein E3N88_43587 [Mikania micrantha]